MDSEISKAKKLCFVTIGATATFDSLIEAVLSQPVLEALLDLGYTDLLLQHGLNGEKILERFYNDPGLGDKYRKAIQVSGFAFNKNGLGEEMKAAKGGKGDDEGVVISHAGSGSILDALRISVPLIVVPNTALLDNHQEELAEVLAAQEYVVHGKLNDLAAALKESDILRRRRKIWPPPNSGHDPSYRGLAGVMDDEMGFLD